MSHEAQFVSRRCMSRKKELHECPTAGRWMPKANIAPDRPGWSSRKSKWGHLASSSHDQRPSCCSNLNVANKRSLWLWQRKSQAQKEHLELWVLGSCRSRPQLHACLRQWSQCHSSLSQLGREKIARQYLPTVKVVQNGVPHAHAANHSCGDRLHCSSHPMKHHPVLGRLPVLFEGMRLEAHATKVLTFHALPISNTSVAMSQDVVKTEWRSIWCGSHSTSIEDSIGGSHLAELPLCILSFRFPLSFAELLVSQLLCRGRIWRRPLVSRRLSRSPGGQRHQREAHMQCCCQCKVHWIRSIGWASYAASRSPRSTG